MEEHRPLTVQLSHSDDGYDSDGLDVHKHFNREKPKPRLFDLSLLMFSLALNACFIVVLVWLYTVSRGWSLPVAGQEGSSRNEHRKYIDMSLWL